MGCGNSKVLPEASKKGYVSVVQSLVAFSKAHDDCEPEKWKEKQKGRWFSAGLKNLQPVSSGQQETLAEGQQQDRVEKYKDNFDPRVTARYHIKALIGRGSFSRVVRAEHRATRRPFAIKMMEVGAPGGRQVCAAELAVLRRVRHRNVVRLVEVFESPHRAYMVLELATGGELLDRVVSRGHFTERDACRALRMVLDGVGYLHSLGITHRDLKPENLLYYHPGADSRLLVTDFGLATFGCEVSGLDGRASSGDDTETDATWSLRTTCGTPEYMAPEVILRKPYSCAVDMWAVGVIAYIILSGSMPFEDDSRTRLYRSIMRGKYSFRGEPWPSVSSQAKDFVRHLLLLEPAERLTAPAATHHSWVVAMAEGPPNMRNLHRSISRNLRRRGSRSSSSRCQSRATTSSTESQRSQDSRRHWRKKGGGGLRAPELQRFWTD